MDRVGPRLGVGIPAPMRHPAYVTASAHPKVEIAPISATPLAGLGPWFAPLIEALRASVANENATSEERQLLSLIEYVGEHFGDPLLRALTSDDLDDQLDSLVASPEALHCTVLLSRLSRRIQTSEPVTAEGFAETVSEHLGAAQARLLIDARETLAAWLEAQRQASALVVAQPEVEPERIFGFSLASPEIPAELAELVFHSLRATFCFVAIFHAVFDGQPVELARVEDLVSRLVTSAKEHLRLLASLPGVHVDESIVPADRRLDLSELDARHRRARSAAHRSLLEARTRLGL